MAVPTTTESRSLLHNKVLWGVSALLGAGLVALLIWLVINLASGEEHDEEGGETPAAQLQTAPDVLTLCNVDEIAKLPVWEGTGTKVVSKEEREKLAKISTPLEKHYKLTDNQATFCPKLVKEAKVVEFFSQVPPPSVYTTEMTKTLLDEELTNNRLAHFHDKIKALRESGGVAYNVDELLAVINGKTDIAAAANAKAMEQLKHLDKHRNEIPDPHKKKIGEFIEAYNYVHDLADNPPSALDSTQDDRLHDIIAKYGAALGLKELELTKLTSLGTLGAVTQVAKKDALINKLVGALTLKKIDSFKQTSIEAWATELATLWPNVSDPSSPKPEIIRQWLTGDTKDTIIKRAVDGVKPIIEERVQKILENCTTADEVTKKVPIIIEWLKYLHTKSPFTGELSHISTEPGIKNYLASKFRKIIDNQLNDVVREKPSDQPPVATDFEKSLAYVNAVKAALGVVLGEPTLDSPTLTASALLDYCTTFRWQLVKDSAVATLIDQLSKEKTVVSKGAIDNAFKSMENGLTKFGIPQDNVVVFKGDNPTYHGMLHVPKFVKPSTPDQRNEFLKSLAVAMLKHRYDSLLKELKMDDFTEYFKLRALLIEKFEATLVSTDEQLKKESPKEILISAGAAKLVDIFNKSVDKIFNDGNLQVSDRIGKVRELCNRLINIRQATGKFTCTSNDDVTCKAFNAATDINSAYDVYYSTGTSEQLWTLAKVKLDPSIVDVAKVTDAQSRVAALKVKPEDDRKKLLDWEYAQVLRKLVATDPATLHDFKVARDNFQDLIGMSAYFAFSSTTLEDKDFVDFGTKRANVEEYLLKIVVRGEERNLLNVIRNAVANFKAEPVDQVDAKFDKIVNLLNSVNISDRLNLNIYLGDLILGKFFENALVVFNKEIDLAKAEVHLLKLFIDLSKVDAATITDQPTKDAIAEYVKTREPGIFYQKATALRQNLSPPLLIEANLAKLNDYATKACDLVTFYNAMLDPESKGILITNDQLNILTLKGYAFKALAKLLLMDKSIQLCAPMEALYTADMKKKFFDITTFKTLKGAPTNTEDLANKRKDALKAIYEYSEANFDLAKHLKNEEGLLLFLYNKFYVKTKTAEEVLKDAEELRDAALDAHNVLLAKADLKRVHYSKALYAHVKNPVFASVNKKWTEEFQKMENNLENAHLPMAHLLFTLPKDKNSVDVLNAAALYIASQHLYDNVRKFLKEGKDEKDFCAQFKDIDLGTDNVYSLATKFADRMHSKKAYVEEYFKHRLLKAIKEKSSTKQFETTGWFTKTFDVLGVPDFFKTLPTVAPLCLQVQDEMDRFIAKHGFKDFKNMPTEASKELQTIVEGRFKKESEAPDYVELRDKLLAAMARHNEPIVDENAPPGSTPAQKDNKLC